VPEVRRATLLDADVLVAVAAAAFYDDPVMSWIFPDAAERLGHLRIIFCEVVNSFVSDQGTVHLFDEASASFWRPPAFDHEESESAPEGDGGARPPVPALPGVSLERLRVLGTAVAAAHPRAPHWYLNVLGTKPERQGQGLGARVLEPVLVVCDSDAMPAYLESSNPRNIGFYQRQGFEPTGEIKLPDGPSLYPMWREPSPRP
jgi:ribosomal protein S18 acetylase RimI-like enzyme